MKILVLSNCPLAESQGSGYVILNFCRGLRDRGHTVDLFGPETYELWPSLRGRANSYRQALGMVRFVLKQLSRNAYDLIEFYGGEAWLIASILARWSNRSFCLVSHSNGLEPSFYNALTLYARKGLIPNPFGKWYQLNQTQLFKLAFTQVDGIVTVSHFDRTYALNQGYQDEHRVVAIENALPDEYLNRSITWERPPRIGFCGSWIARKGTHLMIADLPRLLREFPEYRLQFIGVGDSFQPETHFPLEVCDRIEVIPYVESKETLQQLYSNLSILMAPSLYESFGLTIAEGMACGCAVVAGCTGFAASLRHQAEAWVLEEVCTPSLYDALKTLILNEPLRLKMAQAGYNRVQSLRWDTAIDQLEQTYLTWIRDDCIRKKSSLGMA
ncbi:MAG: glycosyltransferase family 4 protein [Leptolyngbyaceae cyanobacterium bins.59]|nr:glycosyltransferase family 4 protein [Leptolyngbyaceae cyanobacterium bins.59]